MSKSSRIKTLVKCPKCNCSIRLDRLETHLFKVHKQQKKGKNKTNRSTKKRQKSTRIAPLNCQKFERVLSIVQMWLMENRRQFNIESPAIKVLTIMVVERFLKYNLDEINQLNIEKLSLEKYEHQAKRLKIVYENMMDDIYTEIVEYRKYWTNIDLDNEFDNNPHYSEGECSDWYDCNTVDREDGSKYIGYYRREYQDSQFGSFPLHDDYGEESWSDVNPWE